MNTVMTPEILGYILLALTILQAYVWWKVSVLRAQTILNMSGLLILFATKVEDLEKSITALKQQLDKYEQRDADSKK